MPDIVEKHTFRSKTIQSLINEAVTFTLNTPIYQLPIPEFTGTGVYLLYYLGELPQYSAMYKRNHDNEDPYPIYVGKAVPSGWRSARQTQTSQTTKKLYLRINEHRRSIEQAANLNVMDFMCRFAILEGQESDLISTLEAALIRHYKPLWNTAIDGFGNHDPGKGRYGQAPSEWDTLHPGRAWASRLTGTPPNLNSIKQKITQYFESIGW